MDNVRCLRCGHIYEKDRKLCPNCDEALLDASAATDQTDLQDDDERQHHRKNEHALLTAAAETVLVSAVISHLSEEIRTESSEESGAGGIEIVIDTQESPADTASNYQTGEVIDGECVEEETMGVAVVPGDNAVVVVVDEAGNVTADEAACVVSEEEAEVVSSDDVACVVSGDDGTDCALLSDDLQHHEYLGSDE